ncbi:Succinate--hydroxymethylglutarate CoA-transferase [Aphelenchoides besseyi]|nr:Succinate--hydroxymethylglutarate CoA-transferase [Aphelenchoides besseyi]
MLISGLGDEVRRWQPPVVNGQSCYFLTVNRNKKSVALNLGHEEGRSIARKLAAKADVVIENFKTGQMEKYGLSYEQLSEINPKLIYCSITGYGSTGPYANDPGYDAGTAIIDLLTGVHAYSGILMALLARQQNGGVGQRVECNLLSTQIAALANVASNYLNSGLVGKRWGTSHESIVPYQAFKTRDNRYYVVGAADNKSFTSLCELLELPELALNPDYSTNAKRVENREKLFAEHDLEYWKAKLRNSQFPCGPVNNVAEAFAHEQVKHLDLVQEVTHPSYGAIKTVAQFIKKSSTFRQIGYIPYFVNYNGSISTGYVATDCLTSLGIEGREPRVPFPFVDRPRGVLAEAYGDGVFGISNELFSLFKVLSYTLDEPVATFHIYNYSSASGFRNSGQVTYGGNDDSCTDQYVYHPTAKNGEWILNFKQVKFGNVELETGNALVRLGPQKLYAPYAAFEKIMSVLRAQRDSKTSEYFVECATINQLPPLEITVDSIHHKIQPNEYTVPSLDDRSKCIVLIAPATAQVGRTPWILGDIIARNHCVKFNVKDKTIGFGVPITTASSS